MYDSYFFVMGESMATILELAQKMQRGEAPRPRLAGCWGWC